LLLISEGSISRIFAIDAAYSEYEPSFQALLDRLGYEFEMPNHYSFALYPKDECLKEDFLRLHRWQWLQHLSEQKLVELHSEVYEHFAKYPSGPTTPGMASVRRALRCHFQESGLLHLTRPRKE
jgi:hypothetical protein